MLRRYYTLKGFSHQAQFRFKERSFSFSHLMISSTAAIPMAAMNIRCFNRQFSLSCQPLRPVPLPRPRETHLWCMNPDEVKDPVLLKQYMNILSPCEQQNVLRFGEDERRRKALLARAFVRTTIARYQTNSSADPRSLKFKKNLYGKPEVDWQHASDQSPSLHFNISHTPSLIACGITTYTSIGIDVEGKNRVIKNNVLSFARRFFCEDEVEHLASILDPQTQRQEFIKLWTLKEAYVKALGKGFSASPFNTFRIHFNSPSMNTSNISDVAKSKVSEIIVESSDAPNSEWHFALLELDDTHYTAICTEKHTSIEDNEESPMALSVWKTVPFVEDYCMSGTRSVVTVGGFVEQLKSFNSAL